LRQIDVLIVGGGPAGSSCAWQLAHKGVKCTIFDKMIFPRTKLCAGWITPEVVENLKIDIRSYPHRFHTFNHMHFHFPFLGIKSKSLQHSIRRYEFDHWLLERSGASFKQHEVRKIRREGEDYIIDETYRCKYLIGAGGTRCPVFRSLFKNANPRSKELQAVTLEEEFPYNYEDKDCHLWFFENGLPGYSWYVPKQNGYINIGIGAMASRLKQNHGDIKSYWKDLVEKLNLNRMIINYPFNPEGYSYFVRDNVKVARIDNAFILGDAAGLATRDLCEGIGPAVKSGIMAADSILYGYNYDFNPISKYSNDSFITKKLFELKFH